ncbi:MFS transporter [Sulfolobus acidocaldarius]|uniref:Conserved Archaeal membrane protein n=4 Tax=Sulfolobus acidocaldarius TaxID=2285 RepID=Q4JBP2_SULAC|nr:MFS transporter [Sulfolobus acidocaldarius]AAY79787.1 conserved Archaeal membrane protein [Sulfolobus acidocaldarius DSM 639]AGE70345.1 hypothetical protein SacN8_01820 [Sulfolobus acidocaldarius N8]AGE72620.1 hypothetical protein SacRon12I_01820 [Sulfolobus acidocaldarius Ron12/I]ALU29256.1 hypothetical protein ATY89_04430 [Sulfolobus acidocaldarius]ALU31985.1 hypothetical protein ATZ20_07455 [Sulfolobus acidocaldarius]
MSRKTYVVIGFVIMCFNSIYQYSWNALQPLLKSGFNVSLVQVALGFTLFSIFSSLAQPLGGHFADKQGPKRIGIIAGILSSIGFLGTYLSPNIYVFYTVWSIGSAGEGILYGIAANLAMKWFEDKKGVATGVVSMGLGIGSALLNPFIAMATSYKTITLGIGLTEVIVLPILLWLSDYPKLLSGQAPRQIITTTRFWLIYVSFVTVLVPFSVISSQLSVLGKGVPQQELITLISLLPLLSGGLRPFFGMVADRLGIIRTTLILDLTITLGALFLLLNQIAISTILVGLSGGSMITLYFNVAGEIFGTRFSTVNSGILYTGKALGGTLGSVVFAILYSINLQLSEMYSLICGIIGILALLLVVFTTQQQAQRV